MCGVDLLPEIFCQLYLVILIQLSSLFMYFQHGGCPAGCNKVPCTISNIHKQKYCTQSLNTDDCSYPRVDILEIYYMQALKDAI